MKSPQEQLWDRVNALGLEVVRLQVTIAVLTECLLDQGITLPDDFGIQFRKYLTQFGPRLGFEYHPNAETAPESAEMLALWWRQNNPTSPEGSDS